jgi:hypothetical protein
LLQFRVKRGKQPQVTPNRIGDTEGMISQRERAPPHADDQYKQFF